jgi:uncharacterized protein (DUF4415 family)
VTLEDILNKPVTQEDIDRRNRLAAMPDSEIDYSDIPPLTDEQWAGVVPYRLRAKTTPISFRIQIDVLEWLKSKGPGHLTRINTILATVMEAERRLKSA